MHTLSPRLPSRLCCQETGLAHPPAHTDQLQGVTFVGQHAPSKVQSPLLLSVSVKCPKEVHHVAIHLPQTKNKVTSSPATEPPLETASLPAGSAATRPDGGLFLLVFTRIPRVLQ